MEGECSVLRRVDYKILSSNTQGDQMEGESIVLLEVSSMKFFLGISKEIKWKVKVVLLEIPVMNFILGISKDMKWKVKVVLLKI